MLTFTESTWGESPTRFEICSGLHCAQVEAQGNWVLGDQRCHETRRDGTRAVDRVPTDEGESPKRGEDEQDSEEDVDHFEYGAHDSSIV